MNIIIVLPDTLYIIRTPKNQDIITMSRIEKYRRRCFTRGKRRLGFKQYFNAWYDDFGVSTFLYSLVY